MLETLGFVAFILAILFVAMMAPKPAGRDTKKAGGDPPPREPPAEAPGTTAAPGAGEAQKQEPDSPRGQDPKS